MNRFSGFSGDFDNLLQNADKNKKYDSNNNSSEENSIFNGKEPLVEKVQFSPLSRHKTARKKQPKDFFDNIEFLVSGELGTAEITVRELLKMKEGSVIKLNKMAGDNAAMLVNNLYFGEGEVVVVNDRFGLRITSITREEENEETLREKEKEDKEKDKDREPSSSSNKGDQSSEEG